MTLVALFSIEKLEFDHVTIIAKVEKEKELSRRG